MTKWILLPLFLLVVDLVIAQKIESDSLSLQNISQNVLNQKISFIQKEGKLEAVLKIISSTYNVKFSYSNDKIENVIVKEVVYDSVQLSYLLNSLLLNTGFNYMAVGRMVVLVEEEKKALQLPADSISPIVDSPEAEDPYSNNHIYSSSTDLSHLSDREKRRIKHLYDREVFYAMRNKRYMGKGFRDTTNTPDKPLELPDNYKKDEKDYFISATIGWLGFVPRIVEKSSLDYKRDLSFEYNVQPTLQYGIRLGMIRKHLMFGTGLGYHRFSISGEGKGFFPRGQSGKVDTIIVSFKDTYSVFSIPAEITFFVPLKKIIVGAGARLGLDIIKDNSVANKFENYFNKKKNKEESYSEKDHSLAASASINILAGYSITQNIILAAGLEYQYFFNPYTENSIYTFYPNSVTGKISFFYLLGKADIKNLFYKTKK